MGYIDFRGGKDRELEDRQSGKEMTLEIIMIQKRQRCKERDSDRGRTYLPRPKHTNKEKARSELQTRVRLSKSSN